MSSENTEKKGILGRIFGKSGDKKAKKGGCCSIRIEAEDESTSEKSEENEQKEND